MRHIIVIRSDSAGELRGDCSCGDRIIYGVYADSGLSLDKINQWAHEHIVAAETTPAEVDYLRAFD